MKTIIDGMENEMRAAPLNKKLLFSFFIRLCLIQQMKNSRACRYEFMTNFFIIVQKHCRLLSTIALFDAIVCVFDHITSNNS